MSDVLSRLRRPALLSALLLSFSLLSSPAMAETLDEARQLIENERHDEAQQMLRQVLAQEPQQAEARFLLAFG